MKHMIALLAVLALAARAGATDPQAPTVEAKSSLASIDPIFDCYAANSAWGLSYSGKVVDRLGNIWKYAQRGKTLPSATTAQDRSSYDAIELRAKFGDASKIGNVDPKLLSEHRDRIEKAAAGKITTADAGVRDAGSSSCHAYVLDAQTQRYRSVDLGSDGGVSDWRVTNSAPEAQQLIDWLRSIGIAR